MSTKKESLGTRIKNFFVDSKVELKKVVWPTQKTVFKNTGIVLAMIFVMGVFVAVLDVVLLQLLGTVMSVSTNR